MAERAGHDTAAARDAGAAGWIAFTLAGERFALPMEAVEAVEMPPPLAPVPHAAAALLGAGNFAGRIMPVVDLGGLLGRRQGMRAYDGGGEVVRLRTQGGGVGLWIDRVERLIPAAPGMAMPDGVALLDPERLLAAALEPPVLAQDVSAPLGDVAERVLPAAVAATPESFILVEIAGRGWQLPHQGVVELVEAVPWTRLPRAPAGFWGIGLLRETALPILSLAALLGLPEQGDPGGFAVTELSGHGALLAVDRIVGLRFHPMPVDRLPGERLPGEAEPSAPVAESAAAIDLASVIPEEMRRIVLGFPPLGDARSRAFTPAGKAADYLVFAIAGQDFAVPVAGVDRVIDAQPLVALPRSGAGQAASPVVGVIELSGLIVPVAAVEARLGIARDDGSAAGSAGASVQVILRGPDGLGAIGVERIKQVVRLRAEDLMPLPAEHDLIEAVATADGKLLGIIAVERLWSSGRSSGWSSG
ncbi:MAG TPA: chemotaxis protein CheW [Stellaceae bacterium]|nr:chemotaxis protein CheW [Stellaceae bacterium]